ncbi:MAG: hypothetical protein E7Z93_01025 [Cyanobacteria bacterium SIG32]|nr:hypothetical protein [Cyanobacteria bacterium SIG32]
MKKHKKLILIDLDGVLNKYNGKYSSEFIPEIKEGAKDFLETLSKEFEVKIFTTRNRTLAQEWLITNNIAQYSITNVKEPAYLLVDDRCICFDGDYKKTLDLIFDFRVHWKTTV